MRALRGRFGSEHEVATRAVLLLALLLCAMAGCDRKQVGPEESRAQDGPVERGESLIYVPAYTFATPGAGRRIKLATTLAIHNVSAHRTVRIHSVEYHDSPGKKVRSYLASPATLEPLQTLEFVVNEPSDSEGSGANFIVSFDSGEGGGVTPLVEAVMVGNAGTGWLSFTSRGVVVAE